MPSHPSVSVVIVTWNGRRHLEACLDALAAQTYQPFEIVVVDNASTDGTVELLRAQYPEVRLIRNGRNLGFAPATNLGIRATASELVATLNNDTLPHSGWLEALVRTLISDPSLGSAASKMVFAHAPETINSCGIALDPAGIAWDLWGGRPAALVDRPREVFGPCAGAALYRRAMLDDVGLFDDAFFAYLEDVDLAWRARLRGWRCVLVPEAVVQHAHSGTLGEGSPLKRYLLARNKIWTIARCASAQHLARWLPVIIAYDLGAATFGVVRQRDWASARGRIDACGALPQVLAERREVQSHRTLRRGEELGLLAPLAPPWDVPRRYQHLVQLDPGRRRTTLPPLVAPGSTEPGAVLRHTSRPSGRDHVRAALLRLLGPGLLGRRGSAGAQRHTEVAPAIAGTPRVVAIRPDHLGDVLLSRPAIELLRAALPKASLTIVVGPWGVASLQGVSARIVTFPFPAFTRQARAGPVAPYTALLAFAARLRRERFDAALILRPDHWWGALAVALAGIPVRVGHSGPGTSPFLTHAAAGPPEHATAAALAATRALLEALGVAAPPAPPHVCFIPSAGARRRADGWVRAASGSRPLVAVHPGSGAPLKVWPAHRWAQVIAALAGEVAIVLSGGPGEDGLVAAVQERLTTPTTAALGLSWDELAALYERAALVIGTDSGPLHLAAAVGTPTVRVYGPTDPAIYGPAGPRERHTLLRSALPCAPCSNLDAPPCGYVVDPPCLAQTDPHDVVRRAYAQLGAARG